MAQSTASLHDDEGGPGAPPAGDCLVLAMDTARPLLRPRRATLAGIDEVTIGRGDRDDHSRQGSTLRIEIAAPSVSTHHARLRRGDGGGWAFLDEGSKNGTWVNGERIERRAVGARDLLEVGTAFFLLRAGTHDVAPDDWDRQPEGLRTLSPDLERAFGLLTRVAPSRVPLLLLGETGTGKEVTARAVHRLSGRAGGFTAMNCGGVPETLIASELFGARKGAFSGAHADRAGLVQEAHHGTLFLDEIADLPLAAQAVLLRVVQEHEVTPLGATRPVPVDTRVIAATNDDLVELVAGRKFRKDLYARLSGVILTLPPLRERSEDIGLIVAELLKREAAGKAAAGVSFHRAAARALFTYDWPLNIRELGHALAAAVAVAGGGEIKLEHLPAAVTSSASDAEVTRQREAFLGAVAEQRGNVSAIARVLNTSRSHVRRLAERFEISLEKHRP